MRVLVCVRVPLCVCWGGGGVGGGVPVYVCVCVGGWVDGWVVGCGVGGSRYMSAELAEVGGRMWETDAWYRV